MSNDFYVEFDSNASAFADQLARDLGAAEAKVKSLTESILNLGKATGGGGIKINVQGALAQSAGRGGEDSAALKSNIYEASDELKNIIASVSQTMQVMNKLPNEVQRVLRSVRSQVQDSEGRTPRNVTNGQFGNATPDQIVSRALKSVSESAIAGARIQTRVPLGEGSRISQVPQTAIDQAGADRIVRAIEEQTRSLMSGQRVVVEERTPGGQGTAKPVAPTAAPAAAAGGNAPASKEDFAQVHQDLANLRGLIAQLEGTDPGQATQLKAVAAAMEREITGMSRTEQSAARTQEAASARLEEAANKLALIHSVGAEDFSSNAGRGADKYTKTQLREMADAMTSVIGGEPLYTSKTNKPELVSNLQNGYSTFQTLFGDMTPEALLKQGKPDQINQSVTKVLGNLDEAIATYVERQGMGAILGMNRRSGGIDPTYHTAGGMNSRVKGAQVYGAAIMDDNLPDHMLSASQLADRDYGREPSTQPYGMTTRSEVNQAREALSRSLAEALSGPAMEQAVRNASSANYDPYDKSLRGGIEGNGPQARSAGAFLTAIQNATTQLDEQATHYHTLNDALQENSDFIGRASMRAGTSEEKSTDATKMAAATERIGALLDEIDKIPSNLRELFESDAFKSGMANRATSRQASEAAAMQPARELSAFQATLGGLGAALGGARTAMGSRTQIRPIPGLGYLAADEQNRTGRFVSTNDDIDPKEMEELNRNFTSFAARLARSQQPAEGDNATQNAARLENAATEFLNKLQQLFGVSPSIKQLGVENPSEEALTAQEKRIRDMNARDLRMSGVAARAAATPVNPTDNAGSGGNGGSKKPPTASGGAEEGGGSYFGILRQIYEKLSEIHSAFKSGLKITSAPKGTQVTATPGNAKKSDSASSTKSPDSDRSAAVAAQDAANLETIRQNQSISRSERAKQSVVRAAQEQARTTALVASEESKAAQAALQAEHNTALYASSMRLLSDGTKRAIEELRQLVSTGGSMGDIASKQREVFKGINNDVSRYDLGGVGVQDTAKAVFRNVDPSVSTDTLRSIQRSASADSGFEKVGVSWGQSTTSAFGKWMSTTGNSFMGRVLNMSGRYLVHNFAGMIVFGLTGALSEAVSQALQTQQTFVRVSSTLEATGKDVGNIRQQLQDVSSDYGTSLNDMYDTAAKLAGVFDSTSQVGDATKVVAQLQQLSDGALDANEAVGALTSIWAAFSDELSGEGGVQHIADAATALQNLTGVNIEDTVEGVARLSGQAKSLGLSMDQAATYVAQISRETNTTGDTAGEQLSRILEQMTTKKGQASIRGAFGSDILSKNTINGAVQYGNVLKDMVGDWDNLTKAQQENVVQQVAGTRQAATFNALMDGGTKLLNDLTAAQDSQGEATDRMAKLMRNMNGEITRFKSNFQNLITQLVDTGALDPIGVLIEGTNQLLHLLDDLLGLLNQLGDSNPAIGGIMHLAAAMVGAGAGLKLMKGALGGFHEAMQASTVLTGIRNGASNGASKGSLLSTLTTPIIGGRSAAADAKAATASTAKATADTEAAEAAGTVAAADAKLAQAIEARAVAEGEAAAAAEGSAATGATGMMGKLGKFGSRLTSPLALGGGLLAYNTFSSQHSQGRDILGSVASGAMIGSAIGPEGTVAGAAVGGAVGLIAGAFKAMADGSKEADQAKASLSAFNKELAKTQQTSSGSSASYKSLAGQIDTYLKSDKSSVISYAQRSSLQQQAASYRAQASSIDANMQVWSITHPAQKIKANPFNDLSSAGLDTTFQTMASSGQDAAQQLHSLIDAISGTGKAAKDAKGKFGNQGGTPLDTYSSWLDASQGDIYGALRTAGVTTKKVPGQDFGDDSWLGKLASKVGLNSGASSGTNNDVATLSQKGLNDYLQKDLVQNKAKSPGDLDSAIKKTTSDTLAYLKQFNPDISDGDLSKAKDAILATLYDQEKTYKQVIGQAVLSKSDLTAVADHLVSAAQAAVSNLPSSDNAGKAQTWKTVADKLKAQIAKTPGATPADVLNQLQAAENAYAESAYAELEATRQAAQRNATSKAGIRAAGVKELSQAKALISSTHDADLLVTVIEESGDAGIAMAKNMIANEKLVLKAYKQQLAKVKAELGALPAAKEIDGAEALNYLLDPVNGETSGKSATGSPDSKKINKWQQKVKDQQDYVKSLESAMSTGEAQAPKGEKNTDYFAGLDVPGIQDAQQAQKDAQQTAKDRQALVQARLGVKEAYAVAQGHTVKAAKIEVQIAESQVAAAKIDLKAATTTDERLQALQELANAQAQVVQARAGVRDAKLQDQLDTIDFNLQMNKMTQSSAITALQHILKTENLTKAQRRQLLLQIQGYKNALADSQWNIGDVKLPTPYEMKRYIAGQKKNMKDVMSNAANKAAISDYDNTTSARIATGGTSSVSQSSSSTSNSTTIYIDGADTGKVKKIIEDVVGKSGAARTKVTSGRRRTGG